MRLLARQSRAIQHDLYAATGNTAFLGAGAFRDRNPAIALGSSAVGSSECLHSLRHYLPVCYGSPAI